MERWEKLDIILGKLVEIKDNQRKFLSPKSISKKIFGGHMHENEAQNLIQELYNNGKAKRLVRDGKPTYYITANYETEKLLNNGGFRKLYQDKENQEMERQNRVSEELELIQLQKKVAALEVKEKKSWFIKMIMAAVVGGIISSLITWAFKYLIK